ncbi:aminopeptidase P family protein [Corynebacterium heidelbergense]|uniref:Creatininase n=1 Tax=Corynebacterium heidelbergense TaxID=2055947 RepID=A0A364V751_9CORY|nr:aminopeptidase P family protein [Corynebacterium heidelbergense]RAV32451.1 creatininase [Corynebacterium heidelbergense]
MSTPVLDTHSFLHERIRDGRNGEKLPLTFSDAEMNRRLQALRSHMATDGLDAVVLTSMHNIKYYSDFLLTSFGRSYAMVVTDDSTCTVSAGIDAGMPWRRSIGDNVVYTDWSRGNFHAAVGKAVRDMLGFTGPKFRVGIEHDTMTIAGLAALEGEFGPGVELVDVGAAAMRMRMVKSEEEIQLITDGAQVADIGGEAIREALCAGPARSEYEYAQIGTAAMVEEIARRYPGCELRDTWVWFQSDINTDGAHNWPTTRKVQEGDILSLNCFPMISGYYTALERTMFYGTPDSEHLRYWEINMEVYRRGLELIRPGAVCSEIAKELNGIYAEHGVLGLRTFGYGHSFGVLSHYYGREAGLELREDIDTVLEPGMVVSMEPMLTVPHNQPGAGGYREHDILVVREDRVDNITGFASGPEHNVFAAQ